MSGDRYGDYELVVGLEVHCQLDTKRKLFCDAPSRFGQAPNTCADPYSWGLPGVLPVPNRKAIELGVRLALALECELASVSSWARKHYFYPDSPKGYQITQHQRPYARGGVVRFFLPGEDEPRAVALHHIHFEEDAGKSTHQPGSGRSLVDLNRAGQALVEIVGEPELRSGAEAAAYLRSLRTLVRALGVSDANMQEGSLRCDANVSLRRPGEALGERCEIKNLNSFRFLEAAIGAEARRQQELLESGEPVRRCTLGYDAERARLFVMRSKEDAADYRYMPEPDLPPLGLDAAMVESIRADLPELPLEQRRRYLALGLKEADADLLVDERRLGNFFDAVRSADPKLAGAELASWILGSVQAALKQSKATEPEGKVALEPAALAELLSLLREDKISRPVAKKVFDILWREGGSAAAIVEREGWGQVSDSAALGDMLDAIIADNPGPWSELRGGKDKLRGFFVGQLMKASRGQANPKLAQALIAERLKKA